MAIEVDWSRLARAVEFYKRLGYTYVEAPWTTDAEAANITCDEARHTLRVSANGHQDVLVGSAEVSFLQMRGRDQLPPGKYVAITPCFRYEKPDFLHQEYFMKVELFRDDVCNTIVMDNMTWEARHFFYNEIEKIPYPKRGWTPDIKLSWVKTEEGYDIELNGVEIGSYGIRRLSSGRAWIYATGLAEPRFSRALSLMEETRRGGGTVS